ncbi:MAG: NAD(P)H-binding protein [Puniceicoccaceae bacterium]
MGGTNQEKETRPLVAIAGASGFVGTFLRSELKDAFRFRGLTRSPTVAGRGLGPDGTEWRQCDLFSLPRLTEALEGCDHGFYLVHSMSPSSRLVQGSFADLDLLLADNFVRAAEAAGLRRIVYLGGLLPDDTEDLSPHLGSRREVEAVLRSRSVPVVALRAGLIFGPGGSSFTMLVRLVRRLPFMILPRWVGSTTQSIDVLDVARAFRLALTRGEFAEGVFDLAGHEAMTYRELILRTGRLLGREVRFVDFPFNVFGLSRRWVALFGGVPPALVGPLLESLTHNLRAHPNPMLAEIAREAVPLEQSLRKAVDERGRPLPSPRAEVVRSDTPRIRMARLVRSVQRMPLPPGWDAADVAREYGNWLTRRFGGLLSVTRSDEGGIRFDWTFPRVRLLRLDPTPFTAGARRRRAFYITGGALTRAPDPPGRFEFRIFPQEGFLVAAIHGFEPRLPWWIYAVTQAKAHLFVMRRFGGHLGRIAAGRGRPCEGRAGGAAPPVG